jgi:hypothetical protein
MRNQECREREEGQGGAGRARRLRWVRSCLCLAATIGFAVLSQSGQQQQQPLRPPHPILLPDVNRPPDANDQMVMHEQQAKKQNYAAANIERRKQISDDSARLLKLAADLKAEVDKTTKDTLSLNVIRRADEIEKLAHDVKEKMKLTAGAS